MKVGLHVNISDGLHLSPLKAAEVGGEVFQIFSKNQRQWRFPPLSEETIRTFRENCKKANVMPAAVHASYLVNLASPDDLLWERSIKAVIEELKRAEALGFPTVVLHPGAHKGEGEERGLERILKGVEKILAEYKGHCVLSLETTAGVGTNLGYRFSHIQTVCDNFAEIGVCLDTCHLFAAGYPVHTEEGYEKVMQELEERGLGKKVTCVHLNDSKHPFGSRKDRHQHIGFGEIGEKCFKLFLTDQRWDTTPGILETPKEDDWDRKNVAKLKELRGDKL